MIYPQNWTFFCNFQVKVRLNFELVCKTFLHKRKIKVNYMLVLIESINNKKLILNAAYSIWLRSDLWSTPTNLMSLHIENWGADGSSNFNKIAAYQALYMNYMYIYVFVYHIIFWNIFSRNVYLPILTTGHDFLHSCLHLFGLHLSLLTMAIRVSLSVGAVDLSFLDLDDICKVMILYIFHVLKIIPLKKI